MYQGSDVKNNSLCLFAQLGPGLLEGEGGGAATQDHFSPPNLPPLDSWNASIVDARRRDEVRRDGPSCKKKR